MQRYERETPGDLIHIDVKMLARFRKVGHRISGNRQQGRSTRVGYDRVHVAIDVRHSPGVRRGSEVGGFCWTVLAPEIVNSGREV